ncbi:LuxR C-terminal-related transcriptional regulator [Nocardia sp. CDC160]|uniref:LuxR C-terminal-related transcriptional regulator n=1 Tax=Nocardia sp. CDC160 TaxID=3112166 RepID=UPI002DBD2DC1|nr:LuxR C-terminal-related transcriptional regulator [Nocardia sp. CDC160]MEC3919267.1 LuxR C-terminal-related transcriptional regulator [Nocardia sp. CDC160]
MLLLGSARLVTLIGSGGIGKTRLAEEAVWRIHRARRTSVFIVRLAGLVRGADVGAVEDAIAAAVLVRGFAGRSEWEGVVEALTMRNGAGRDQSVVLVLDNCEHVLAAVGEVIGRLLDTVAGLTILATSREPVGWIDEQLVPVQPLSVDQSLELFRRRAELTGNLITEPKDVALVQRICRHLHGHPLYIRLAAARMFYEPLAMILGQLSGDRSDMRMRWVHGPRIGGEPRHRTISDVIGWSYDLCDEKERLLLDRLSVFAPGFDTGPEGNGLLGVGVEEAAVAAVCCDDTADTGGPFQAGRLHHDELRMLLDRLVDRSLVSVHISDATVRYSLLESVRLFGQARLADHAEATGVDTLAVLRGRHLRYYRDRLVAAQSTWFSPSERELLDWVRSSWDNIKLAMEASCGDAKDTHLCWEIVAGLLAIRAPFHTGTLPSIRRWAQQTLNTARAQSTELDDLQIGVLARIGWIATSQGQRQYAAEVLEDCLTAEIPDPALRKQWRRAPETDIGLPAAIEFAWGVDLLFRGNKTSIALLARANEKFAELGDRGDAWIAAFYGAVAHALLGQREEALELARRVLQETIDSGSTLAKSWTELAWAMALTKNGKLDAAYEAIRDALAVQIPARDRWGGMWSVIVRTWVLARTITDHLVDDAVDRQQVKALATEIAMLAGGIKTFQKLFKIDLKNLGPLIAETDVAMNVALKVLGQREFLIAEAQGSALRLEDDEPQRLAAGTLAVPSPDPENRARPEAQSEWDVLSGAEQGVAVLAAAGWSNSSIGARRGTSTKTVDAQIYSIFQKLAITSRADIARFVPEAMQELVQAERDRRPRRQGERARR